MTMAPLSCQVTWRCYAKHKEVLVAGAEWEHESAFNGAELR